MKVKNIFWTVDGVLADLNFAYYNFLKNHPNYSEMFKDMEYKDLPNILPIHPKYGAVELKTHPTLSTEMDYDFCHSPEFFENRPLYPDAAKTLRELDSRGIKQIIVSGTFDIPTKTKFLNKLFADLPFLNIECVKHGTFLSDESRDDL